MTHTHTHTHTHVYMHTHTNKPACVEACARCEQRACRKQPTCGILCVCVCVCGSVGTVLSQRYADAVKKEEWHPGMPGAVRPGTGEQWDYRTGKPCDTHTHAHTCTMAH